ncbi:pilus assembly PilX family protein [Neisseria montereyensis]|uniref:Pilus assembly protein n=1 Tax=Neisseria montereyensis TaxID=2973938 RepID=A0ABT2FD52_9NEIS|nr:pilus assembly protein [Neisseria montereyensis]MCS4533448.1 pilus assembly protein [Neisseria montereyensis]
MRKPYPINFMHKSSQKGFSLFIVLMVMIVVAFFVVSVTQSYNTEQRISTNDADRKFASALAEAALRQGERRIAGFYGKIITFSQNCQDGLCSSAGDEPKNIGDIRIEADTSGEVAWQRSCGSQTCLELNGGELSNSGVRRNPRYIIEYISTQEDSSLIYRVTAKAWGKNANTTVTLQSYVAAN